MDVNCLSSEKRKIFLSESVEKNEAPAEFFSTDEDKKFSDLSYEVNSH